MSQNVDQVPATSVNRPSSLTTGQSTQDSTCGNPSCPLSPLLPTIESISVLLHQINDKLDILNSRQNLTQATPSSTSGVDLHLTPAARDTSPSPPPSHVRSPSPHCACEPWCSGQTGDCLCPGPYDCPSHRANFNIPYAQQVSEQRIWARGSLFPRLISDTSPRLISASSQTLVTLRNQISPLRPTFSPLSTPVYSPLSTPVYSPLSPSRTVDLVSEENTPQHRTSPPLFTPESQRSYSPTDSPHSPFYLLNSLQSDSPPPLTSTDTSDTDSD